MKISSLLITLYLVAFFSSHALPISADETGSCTNQTHTALSHLQHQDN